LLAVAERKSGIAQGKGVTDFAPFADVRPAGSIRLDLAENRRSSSVARAWTWAAPWANLWSVKECRKRLNRQGA